MKIQGKTEAKSVVTRRTNKASDVRPFAKILIPGVGGAGPTIKIVGNQPGEIDLEGNKVTCYDYDGGGKQVIDLSSGKYYILDHAEDLSVDRLSEVLKASGSKDSEFLGKLFSNGSRLRQEAFSSDDLDDERPVATEVELRFSDDEDKEDDAEGIAFEDDVEGAESKYEGEPDEGVASGEEDQEDIEGGKEPGEDFVSGDEYEDEDEDEDEEDDEEDVEGEEPEEDIEGEGEGFGGEPSEEKELPKTEEEAEEELIASIQAAVDRFLDFQDELSSMEEEGEESEEGEDGEGEEPEDTDLEDEDLRPSKAESLLQRELRRFLSEQERPVDSVIRAPSPKPQSSPLDKVGHPEKSRTYGGDGEGTGDPESNTSVTDPKASNTAKGRPKDDIEGDGRFSKRQEAPVDSVVVRGAGPAGSDGLSGEKVEAEIRSDLERALNLVERGVDPARLAARVLIGAGARRR